MFIDINKDIGYSIQCSYDEKGFNSKKGTKGVSDVCVHVCVYG